MGGLTLDLWLKGIDAFNSLSWDYIVKLCEARYADLAARLPYASEQDLISTAAPFLIEHKISGELLGLSGLQGNQALPNVIRTACFTMHVGVKIRWLNFLSTTSGFPWQKQNRFLVRKRP